MCLSLSKLGQPDTTLLAIAALSADDWMEECSPAALADLAEAYAASTIPEKEKLYQYLLPAAAALVEHFSEADFRRLLCGLLAGNHDLDMASIVEAVEVGGMPGHGPHASAGSVLTGSSV